MKKLFPLFCLFFIALTNAKGQEFTGREAHLWTPITPAPESVLDSANEGIYIKVRFHKDYSILENTVRVYVDDEVIESNVKVYKDNLFTAIYTKPLKPGRHMISVEARSTTSFWFEPYNWFFYVKEPAVDPQRPKQRDSTIVTGTVTADSRITLLSGPGKELRQEPPHTTQLAFDIGARRGDLTFNTRGFLTSDEGLYKKTFQSRNYFQLSAGWKGLTVTAGDMNPVFDRIVLTGTRVKGFMVSYRYKKIELKVVRGILARAVDGSLQTFNPVTEMPPPNLRPDSTYITPGIYKRDITAARLQFGMIAKGNTFGISVLKAKDDISTIKYGAAPKDNLVVGFDQNIVGYDSRVKVSWGWAMSGLSNDISTGLFTKPELDSIVGKNTKNPIDPYKWRRILVINESTVVPTDRTRTTFINTTIRIFKTHYLFLEHKKFGTSFVSFGNPYQRADQKIYEAQERFNFFKRKINGYVRYQYMENNLAKTAFTTLVTTSVSGMLNIMPGPKWPYFYANVLQQQRRNKPTGEPSSIYFINNDDIITYNAGMGYNVNVGKRQQGLNVNFIQTERKDLINPLNSNKMRILSATLQTSYGIPLSIDFQYNTSLLAGVDGAFNPLTSTYGFTALYKLKKMQFDIGAGYLNNQMYASLYSPASSRPVTRVFVNYTGLKQFIFNFEAGSSPYTDTLNEINNYNETYIFIRASYLISSTF